VTGHWLDDRYAVRWRGLTVAEPFDCRIDHWPVSAERFRTQHEATRAWSPFNFELMFNLVRGDGRIGVAHGQAVRIAADGTISAEPMTDRMGYLVDVLGISETLAREIPTDLSTPPPPGSRTASEQHA
jgi:hypothetical protein